MFTLAKEELRTLVETARQPDGPCISIYMPTHRAGAATQQDPICYRNLLRQAEERLRADGLRTAEITDLLDSAQELLSDPSFWRHLENGLALFIRRGLFRVYRVPRVFEPQVVVGPRIFIKPLLPLLSEGGRYYLLALGRNAVRLLQGGPDGLRELALPNTPRSLAEALNHEVFEKVGQYRGAGAGSARHGAGSYYGAADDEASAKERLGLFCQQVEQGVQQQLRDERSPLVLAGVDSLLCLYREVSRYPHLAEAEITGNPDRLTPAELHARAWAVVDPLFRRKEAEALAQYRQLAAVSRASADAQAIIPAACHGRVEALFVAQGTELWGRYDPETNSVDIGRSPAPDLDDLMDLAAVEALLHNGSVYAVAPEQMPAPARLAAILRY
jgi:hypothetical protein